jgi:hypothetical protein
MHGKVSTNCYPIFAFRGVKTIEICGGMRVQYNDICTRRRTRHEWERNSKVRMGKHLILEEAMRAQRGSRGIFLLFV